MLDIRSCFILVSYFAPDVLALANGNATAPSIDSTTVKQRQGWTSAPNQRGTWDIILSCALTMGLCSWSIINVNVPAPADSAGKILRRRCLLTALTFLGPEFLFQIAFGQYLSARRSTKNFRPVSKLQSDEQWSLKHAFFADAGGFALEIPEWPDKQFPLNAAQIQFLVEKDYMDFPIITTKELDHENRVETLTRIITILQVIWFVANVVARLFQNLAITCIEITTAAFIIFSIAVTFCWWQKPANVVTARVLHLREGVTMEKLLMEAGDAARDPYKYTPLDFVSREEWPWSLYWSNWVNILRNMGIVVIPRERPIQCWSNTQFLKLDWKENLVFLAMTAVYSSIFLFAFNHEFPTRTELHLWRAATMTIPICLLAYAAITEITFNLWPSIELWYISRSRITVASSEEQVALSPTVPDHFSMTARTRSYFPRTTKTNSRPWTRILRRVTRNVRNNTISNDPQLTVPLKAIIPLYVVGVFYCHARAFTFLEDILELRSLPTSAYQTIQWSDFIPHI